MPTVSQPVEPISQTIRRSSIPIRQTADKDMALRSRPRRVSFPDQPRVCSELKTSTGPETLETRNLVSNPVGSLSPLATSREGRELGAKRSPQIQSSQSSLRTIKSGSIFSHTVVTNDIRHGEPEAKLVIKGLEGLVQSKLVKLNIRHLVEAYSQYLIVFGKPESDGRESIRATEVFGVSLHELPKHTFTSALFNGHDLRLPTVVFNCVEELYRTGIYQSDLFRTLPSRRRLSELVRIFNSPDPHRNYQSSNRNRGSKVAEYNATLLYLESTQDICALLTDYLWSLPEPIVPPYLLDAIWEAGGLNKEADKHEPELGASLSIEESQRRQSSPSLVRTYTHECEATRIKIVQHLLCLLPSPNFSLFVYLLSFFSHVAMMRDVNGASTQELGRLFGKCIFGGRGRYQPPSEDQNGAYNTKDGKVMMCWFLRRWGALSSSLFDVLEACSTKQSPVSHMAEENLAFSVHSDTTPSSDKGLQKQYDHPSPHSTQLPSQDVPSSRNANFAKNLGQSGAEEIREILAGQSLSRKNSTVRETRDKGVRESEEQKEPFLSTSASMSRATSVYSAPANERLLDVAFPALFDNFHFLDNASSEALVVGQTTDANKRTANERQEHQSLESDLLQAQAKIRKLELQLVKSDAMVGQAMEVMFRAKLRIDEIDDRLEELAIILRCRQNLNAELPPDGFGPGRDGKIWKERFEMVLMERRQAYEEVMALRELMSAEL